MRPARSAAVGLFALLWGFVGTGCMWWPRPATVTAERVSDEPDSASRRPDRPDHGVVLHTRLIEQPAGNDYLNRGVWLDATDPLPHPVSALLAVNGLRVGILTGLIPTELERLARSEASAVSPMLRGFQFGQSKAVPVNGPIANCSFAAKPGLGDDPVTHELTAAECGLVVTVTADGDRLRVRCEPRVQHATLRPWFRPTADGTTFERHDQRPTEAFPTLAWEVTLDRKDVLVIGATVDAERTLGEAFFFATTADRPRQRVLTLQAGVWGEPADTAPAGSPAALAR